VVKMCPRQEANLLTEFRYPGQHVYDLMHADYCYRSGNSGIAMQIWEKLIDDGHPNVKYKLGQYYETEEKQLEKAIEHYEKCQDESDTENYRFARMALSRLYLQTGQY